MIYKGIEIEIGYDYYLFEHSGKVYKSKFRNGIKKLVRKALGEINSKDVVYPTKKRGQQK